MELHRKVIEHETSVHPDSLALSRDQQLDFLQHSERLDWAVSGVKGPALSVFLHKAASHSHILVLTERTAQEQPVGYLALEKRGSRWVVLDVWLQASLRSQGVVTNLYRALTVHGYQFQSGDVVSKDAERVWKRLGELGIAKVLNTKTDKVEEFSTKPIGDEDMMAGVAPTFYWITEKFQRQFKGTVNYSRLNDQHLQEGLKEYLYGAASYKTIGIGTFIVDADI